jgi:hypothetical protein
MANLAFAFNSKSFSDFKVIIYQEDTATEYTEMLTSRIILASTSQMFQAMFTQTFEETKIGEYKIVVADEQDAILHERVIKSIYTKTLEYNGFHEFLKLLAIYQKYLMTDLLNYFIVHYMTNNKTLDVVAAMELVELENLYESQEWKSFVLLAQSIVCNEYEHNFKDVWQTVKFLQLTPKALIKVIQSQDAKSQFKYSNTVYQACKRWFAESKNALNLKDNEEEVAIQLLSAMDFYKFTPNFLKDVVAQDNFLCVSPKSKQVKTDHIMKALEYHSCSGERQRIMYPNIRSCYPDSKTDKCQFQYTIKDVKEMLDGQYYTSDSYFLEGYWLRLYVGKIDNKLNVFLQVDLLKTGLGDKFFFRTTSSVTVWDKTTNVFELIYIPSVDTFTQNHIELGWHDYLKIRNWQELSGGTSRFSDNGRITFDVNMTLYE